MPIQPTQNSPTQNLSLAIALERKYSVLVATRVPWSQFMVPQREKGDQGLLGGFFVKILLLLQKTIESIVKL